jgi:hypothetical protein
MNTGGGHQQDEELEQRIHAVYDALLSAPTREQRQCCALRMAELVALRSPERVREMEIERFGRAFG